MRAIPDVLPYAPMADTIRRYRSPSTSMTHRFSFRKTIPKMYLSSLLAVAAAAKPIGPNSTSPMKPRVAALATLRSDDSSISSHLLTVVASIYSGFMSPRLIYARDPMLLTSLPLYAPSMTLFLALGIVSFSQCRLKHAHSSLRLRRAENSSVILLFLKPRKSSTYSRVPTGSAHSKSLSSHPSS